MAQHAFSYELVRSDAHGMKIDRRMHTPWPQLPLGARFCFILFFSGVFGPEDLDHKAVVRELAKIWDSERLSLGFLEDHERFWDLYRKYQEKYHEGVWRLEGYGISREEAEWAGFTKGRTDTPIAHLCPVRRPRGSR